MHRLSFVFALSFLGAAALASAATPPPAKTAAEVIERNVAARGGLDAWQHVDTLVYLGRIERADAKDDARVPFVMQMKRPNLTRFEVKEKFSQYTRIFDGRHGWRIRPGPDGRAETKAFSPAEIAFAQAEYVIDSPLIDYRAKGVTAELDGVDRLDDGRKAYRLSLKLPSGDERKVWIDVKTNLDVRYDRPATSPLAPGKPVSVYYSDFRVENGLRIPHSIETTAEAGRAAAQVADKLVIERVLVNPKLDELAFAQPPQPLRRGGGALVRVPAGGPGGAPSP